MRSPGRRAQRGVAARLRVGELPLPSSPPRNGRQRFPAVRSTPCSNSSSSAAHTGRLNVGWFAWHFEQLTVSIERDPNTTHAQRIP